MNMGYSCANLNDLPEEILLSIFKKLSNVVLLYSLIRISARLNKIAHDSIFTKRLALMTLTPNGCVYPLADPILDRFCSYILPEIHKNIEWLELESSSMERILLATNYLNLSKLGIYKIEAERAIHLFSDETLFKCTLKKQISALVIDTYGQERTIEKAHKLLFTHILTTFTNLQYLSFGPSSYSYQQLSFNISSTSVFSSTLLELHVCLKHFNDCLYLLDGRLNQLQTFHVKVQFITISRLAINNKHKLPNLRSFSLYCDISTDLYDELIVPLLNRMLNLEKLDLCLIVWVRKTLIDGNVLKTSVINYMPRLKRFTFNISSSGYSDDHSNLPSNVDIQKTFKDFKDNQIISCVDYYSRTKTSRCRIYSYPYKLKYYNEITNNFTGGLFERVVEVSLVDDHPFEHKFFLQIAQSFPLLRELTVINQERQTDKQFRKSKNETKDCLIIEYPNLIHLDLSGAHIDYHEQFLVDTKTCLPNNLHLSMNYRSAKKVTRNFRRNTTRSNCAKPSYVFLFRESIFPEHLKDYFPNAKIM
ncbi:hypothetical protein I4U23_015198 [Adineta vaga]|nr:hypothetical protein I4U23_015198 [Adineta vaga]